MMMFRIRRGIRFRDKEGKVWTLDRIHISGSLQFIDADGFVQTTVERELRARWHAHEWTLDPTSESALRETFFAATPRDMSTYPPEEISRAERKLAAIEAFINKPNPRTSEIAAHIVRLRGKGFTGKVSVRSIRRWLTAFKQGRDVTALTNRPHARRKNNASYQNLLDQAVEDVFLRKERPTRTQVLEEFQRQILKHNRNAPAYNAIRAPSRASFFRRMRDIDMVIADRARLGRFESNRKHRTALKHAPAKFVLDRIELDHTLLDLILTDGRSGKALGRPWLTVAIDVYSKMIVGVHLTFEAPSSHSVLQCLKCAVLPKEQLLTSVAGMQNSWPVAGLFKTVVFDNGLDAHGGRVRDFCQEVGSSVQYCPSRSPWFKGTIERFFRTLNQGLLHSLPGTTFSNPRDRAGYAAESLCQMDRQEFLQVLLRWIVDVYHVRPHSRNGMPPLERWNANAATVAPEFPASPADLDLLVARRTERHVHHYGVEIDKLAYNSPALQDIHRRIARSGSRKSSAALHVRYHDDTVAYVDVLDPATNTFVRVPAVDEAYASGVDRHLHRVIRRTLNKKFGRHWRLHDRLAALEEIRTVVDKAGAKKRKLTRAFNRAKALEIQATRPRARLKQPAPDKKIYGRRTPNSELPEIVSIDASHLLAKKHRSGEGK